MALTTRRTSASDSRAIARLADRVGYAPLGEPLRKRELYAQRCEVVAKAVVELARDAEALSVPASFDQERSRGEKYRVGLGEISPRAPLLQVDPIAEERERREGRVCAKDLHLLGRALAMKYNGK
jgi:hypothetical protein